MTEQSRQDNKNLEEVKARFSTGSSSLFVRLLPAGVLIWTLVLWLISLPYIKPRNMTDIGLMSVLPVPFYFGLIILTLSFCFLAFYQPYRRWILNLHIILFILMIHATPTIVYGTLRYSWAWKHVGIVDYITRNHSVNPTINFLAAYHNWPGFFELNAFLVEAAGLKSALAYAPAATLFFNLMFLGALLLVMRALTVDQRRVWLAVWFFFLTNWVGQDYFAPQPMAFFFYLVIVGILLSWFSLRWNKAANQTLPAGGEGRIRRGINRVREMITAPVSGPTTPMQRAILMAIVVILMAVINFSHQLTPLVLLLALGALALLGRIYPRKLPVLALVMMAVWSFVVAGGFSIPIMRESLTDFGLVTQNISSNLIDLRTASTGQVVVALMGRWLTLLVILLGMLGFFRRLLKGHLDLNALVLALLPFPLLAVNSYGGEVLFRIYLFSLPFLTFFIAGLFVPEQKSGQGALLPIGASVLSLVIIVSFMFAYYGKERQYYFTQQEVVAANVLYDNALPGSLIIEGTRNYPTLFRNYELYNYVPVDREPMDNIQNIAAHPAAEMMRWMENRKYPATYLFITRSMKAELEMIGDMPPGFLEKMEQEVRASDKFDILYENQDAVIFILKDRE